MKYGVTIEETLTETFEIEVDEGDDVIAVVAEKYRKGELVLESGNVQCVQVMAEKADGSESTNWIEI